MWKICNRYTEEVQEKIHPVGNVNGKKFNPGHKNPLCCPNFSCPIIPQRQGRILCSTAPNFKWGERTAFLLKTTSSFPSPCTFPTQRADKVSPIYFPRQLFLSIPESWVQFSPSPCELQFVFVAIQVLVLDKCANVTGRCKSFRTCP